MIPSVRLRPIIVLAVLLAATGLRLAAGQTPAAPAPAADPRPRSPYFSGFVRELKPDSIVVSRKASNGKSTIQKVFSIDPHTSVEGKLKVNSRVTVRYETLGNIQRAIHIIVR
jgi:hypothetical protein